MTRFRPTRAGIINLWDYRDEEFVFADGRLVLRGPNGSGKTKALEVLFPFVLDGRIDPRRLNPFAGEERTMKSNLLYRGQDTAHAYVWLEFGRDDEAVTVGVGMRAQKHNDKVARWYFVVDGRVGVDFSLLAPDDRPLTKKQLVGQIGAGRVTDSPPLHRAAIDERLFGLGAERYEQLLTLVLTLRRPQLAKNLDPRGLSRTLSDGLRPIDEDMIAEAARSFDDMESVQHTLDGLVRADEAATSFLSSYTTYLRTHARAAVDVVARRLDEVDAARAELDAAGAARVATARAREDAEAEVTRLETVVRTRQAHLESLQRSKAYTDDREKLDQLGDLVERLAQAARQQRGQADRARRATDDRADELAKARESLSDAQREVSRGGAQLAEAAQDASIGWTPNDAVADEGFSDRLTARVAQRQDDVDAVRAERQAVRDALQLRGQKQEMFDAAELKAGHAEDAERQAADRVAAARTVAEQRLSDWSVRHGIDAAELVAALELVGEPDAPTLVSTFDALVGDQVEQLRETARRLRARKDEAEAALEGLRTERQRVADERDDAPPLFAARTASREDRPGAPLWRLVRFAEDVPAELAASVEAALEAANLLDAWLDEDTAEPAASDAWLVPLPENRRPSGRTLADVLVPEDDVAVSAARITAVLSSIAIADVTPLRDVPTVSERGEFAQGVQIGAHHKTDAEYIGATARARRREARLAEIDRTITAAQNTIDALVAEIVAAAAGLDVFSVARNDLPATTDIVLALRRQTELAVELRVHRTALDEARRALDQAIAMVADRERRLGKIAAERSLPSEDVDRVALAVRRFSDAGARLISLRREESTRVEFVSAAEKRLEVAESDAERLGDEAAEAEVQHAEQAEGLRTLRESVGADVTQVVADVAATKKDIGELESALRVARTAQNKAVEQAALAEGGVRNAETKRSAAVAEARTDARRLEPYARPELLDLLKVPAGPLWPATAQDWLGDDLPQPVRWLIESITTVTADLRPTETSLKQSKTRVSTALGELQAQLSAANHDYQPEWGSDGDVITVRVADEQGFAPIGDFARRITAARRDQEQLLTESERRVLEDALLGRLAQQIHDRTVDARDLIGRMNTEMRARRMSSGAGVGVRWELADTLDEGQRDICKLLERDASRLGPDELARMRAHFASRIKTARALPGNRTYTDLLTEVLDYRKWRTFAFTLVASDGTEERLTQARHSTLSGGEQSVSLHLPLFAAAHVLLSSATEHAPRLLALDEAFAGVDDKGRSELLQLTAQFDLDLFMTGYDLWATYATVPACAHYDLSHSAAEHTVSALLVVWDGSEILADSPAGNLATELGSPGTRRRFAEGTDIFT